MRTWLLGLIACLAAFANNSDVRWITEAGGTFEQDKAGHVARVDLRSSWVTDAEMSRLAELPHLAALDLSLTRISDSGLRALSRARGITDLNLYFAEQITDDGMSAIRDWKHLKRLIVRGTRITDSTLEMLSNLSSLETLDIGYAQVTDAGLAHLGALEGLRSLAIGGNKLAGSGLLFLRQLPHLRYLDLGGIQRTDSGLWSISLTDEGIAAIASIADLRELRLAGTAVPTGSVELLKDMPALERLSLEGCRKVDDRVVPVLLSMKQLRRVDLYASAVTDQGRARLTAARPGLQVIR